MTNCNCRILTWGRHFQNDSKPTLKIPTSKCQHQNATSKIPAAKWHLINVSFKKLPNFRVKMSNLKCQLQIVIFDSPTSKCQLQNDNFKMSTSKCQLQNVNFKMSTSKCQLQNVNFKMSTSKCQLQNVISTLKHQLHNANSNPMWNQLLSIPNQTLSLR